MYASNRVKDTYMKIARMPYINVDPFYYTLEHAAEKGAELIPGYPRQIGRLAEEQDTIDAGPISVMDFLKLQYRYEPLDRMCVAVKEKAGSVTMFSKHPIEKLDKCRIGITSQTSTSRVLLRLILEHRYGITPAEYLEQPEHGQVDAYLFIGNNALVYTYKGLKDFEYIYDLGEEWRRWTGLPFVFAVWAIRKAVPGHEKDYLTGLLKNSLNVFWQNEKEMAQKRSKELLIPADFIENYWHLFIYNRTDAVDKSLELFTDSIKKIKGVAADGQKKI